MFKASVYCAFVTTIAMFVHAFIEDPAPIEMSWNSIFGMATVASLLWALGFAFCRVLLVPLTPLFMRGSLAFSFIIFILVGFMIPALLGLWVGQMSTHGEVLPLFETDNGPAVRLMLVHGAIGMLGAASAWVSLKLDTTATRPST